MPFSFKNISGLSGTNPKLFFASNGLLFILFPSIKISPSSIFKIPVIILIVVVFPAPFGPKKPNISPFFTSKFKLSTDFFPLIYDLETFFISIITSSPHFSIFMK